MELSVCHLGAIFGPSWGHLGALEDILGTYGSHLGATLGHHWQSWERRGDSAKLARRLHERTIFDYPGGHLGAIWKPSWGHLGPFWTSLKPSWAILGFIQGLSCILEPSWSHLGAISRPSWSLARLRRSLFGAILGPSRDHIWPSWEEGAIRQK